MAKKDYWGDLQEEWFTELSTTTDNIRINWLFNKLHPALREMTMAILNRYFSSKYNYSIERSLVVDAITIIAEKVKLYDPTKGKSFSYAQTIIKNYFHTRFFVKTGNTKFLDDALSLQITDIPEDSNFRYITHQKEIEVLTSIQMVTDEIIRKLEYWKAENAKRLKAGKNQVKKKTLSIKHERANYINDALNMLNSMLDIIDQDDFTSYERFMIDVFIKTGWCKDKFYSQLEKLGFNNKGIHGIMDGYEDDFKGKKEIYEPDPDYKDNDHVLSVSYWKNKGRQREREKKTGTFRLK